MKVLMIVQLVDEDEWLRGFIVEWIRALAARVEQVEVLTLEHGKATLPNNVRVHSMGKEDGKNRLRELRRFHQHVSRLVQDVDIVFTHMTPRYAWLAAPYAKRAGIPSVMWYVHRSVTWELKLAHRLVDAVVTASPESFRLPSENVYVIGHGIDMSRFQFIDKPEPDDLHIAAVGRLAPIKNLDALIRVLAVLRTRQGFEGAYLSLAGSVTPEQAGHGAYLRQLVVDLGLDDAVTFVGPVPPDQMPAFYQQADLTANLCPTGGVDKVVLESLATGTLVIVHNDTFLPLLGDGAALTYTDTLVADTIADRIEHLFTNLTHNERQQLSREYAADVRQTYGLDGLMDRLVGVFEEMLR